MAPSSSLHGLNIIQLPSASSAPTSNDDLDLLYPNDSSQDRQLAVWSHLHFDSEEKPKDAHLGRECDEGKEEQRDLEKVPMAVGGLHGSQFGHQQPQTQPNVECSNLPGVAGGPLGARLEPSQNGHALSLTQLIQLSNMLPQTTQPTHVSPSSTLARPPPTKRVRTATSTTPPSTITTGDNACDGPATPSDEKRRRNTAASARFRLKKKEWEAALETKAKQLETKVAELERECEELRHENGWLRGLVVGVTQSGTTISNGKHPREETV